MGLPVEVEYSSPSSPANALNSAGEYAVELIGPDTCIDETCHADSLSALGEQKQKFFKGESNGTITQAYQSVVSSSPYDPIARSPVSSLG